VGGVNKQPWLPSAVAVRQDAQLRAVENKLNKGEPVTTLLADVEPETVAWFWPGRLAFGKLNIIDGDPDQGKSSLTLDLAACITTGRPLPDGTPCEQGNVVFLTAEDGVADTIRPRLDAMGGDPMRVVMFEAVGHDDGTPRPPSFPQDIEALRQVILDAGATVVFVDPVSAFLGGNINSWRDHDVRTALAPLAKLAEETGAAIVLVRHLNKNENTAALYRGGGSIGFIAAARVGLIVASDPNDPTRHVLAVLKNNLAQKPAALAFRIVGHSNGSSRLEWEGAVAYSAKMLLAAGDEDGRSEREEAAAFLRRELRDKPVPADTLFKAADAAGISRSTLKRAKRDIGVAVDRVGFGPDGRWDWRLPIEGLKPIGDRQPSIKSIQDLYVLQEGQEPKRDGTPSIENPEPAGRPSMEPIEPIGALETQTDPMGEGTAIEPDPEALLLEPELDDDVPF
jgi:AAA domain-containing protein